MEVRDTKSPKPLNVFEIRGSHIPLSSQNPSLSLFCLMQVSDMRALKTLYSHHLRNLTSRKPPSLISCNNKPPQNPNSPFRKPFHSTAHRRSSEPDPTNTWINSNSLDNNANNAGSRPGKTNRTVSTVYDPVSGRLVTRRGPKPGSEDREAESSDKSDEDDYTERTYGSVVRRENLGGGGDKGLGLGVWNVNGNNVDVSKERSYGTVRRENLGEGGEKGLGVASGYGNRKKGGKNKVAWVCSSCGHSDGQWWGTCRACSSMGTVVKFVEGVYDGGKTSGFEISENVMRTWLPNQGTETVPLRLTDVNRGVNQTEWRIPL